MRKPLVLVIAILLLGCFSQVVSAQTSGSSTYTWKANIDSENRTCVFDLPASPYGLATDFLVVSISYDCLWRFDVSPSDTYIQSIGSHTYNIELDQSFEMHTTPSDSNVMDCYGDDLAHDTKQISVWPVASGEVCTNYIEQRGSVSSAVYPLQDNSITSIPRKLYVTGGNINSTETWFVYGQPMDWQMISEDYYVDGVWQGYTDCSISASYTQDLTVSATYYGTAYNTAVPEPSSLLVLFGGLGTLAGMVRRNRS